MTSPRLRFDPLPETDLLSIRVLRLFHELNHVLRLNHTQGLTIVTGPNGVGKTTVLRIVDCIFRRRFSELSTLPFETTILDFADGASLRVHRRPSEARKADYEVEFSAAYPDTFPSLLQPEALFSGEELQEYARAQFGSPTYTPGPIGPDLEFPISMIDDYVGHLDRLGSRSWFDRLVGDTLGLDDVLERYSEILPIGFRSDHKTPHWLELLLERSVTSYIRAQRLSTPRSQSPAVNRHAVAREAPTIGVFSDEIVGKIADTLAKYAEFAQSLDSTFPARVLDESDTDTTDDELRQLFEDQAVLRSEYVEAGLLETTQEFRLPPRKFKDGEQRVLRTYFSDTDQKLRQLDDLAKRISLFKHIVNSKFRRKILTVSRQKGFQVTSRSGEPLNLTSLSSGEQQEVVLTYELLFRSAPNTLVLIDEPELSLHVTWQMAFIDDLLKVAELTGLRFLIATHSPQIINDRWDLANELWDH